MSTQDITQAEEEAIRLFTIADEHNEVNSVVPIRWCISPKIARYIEDRSIEEPQLLLVIRKGKREMDRYVVPLKNLMHYVQFRSPGPNIIHATIVWKRRKDSPKKVLTARFDSGEYRAEVIATVKPHYQEIEEKIDNVLAETYRDNDKDEEARLEAELEQLRAARGECHDEEGVTQIRKDFDGIYRLDQEAQLEVVVPDGMFAKKPNPLIQWLGTRFNFWNGAARDECDLRRRALFTVLIGPFALIGIAIVGVIACIGLLLLTLVNAVVITALLIDGRRGLSPALLNPFESDPKNILRSSEPSVWRYKVSSVEDERRMYEERTPTWIVLNPTTVILISAICGLVGLLVWSSPINVMIGGLVGLLIVALIATLVASGPAKRRLEARRAHIRKEEVRLEKMEKEALRRELELLTCGTQSSEVSLQALPKERRTVVLRFHAFKASVCKPFAK